MDVLSQPVLIVNKYYQPLQLATVRRAFVLLFCGAADAVTSEGDLLDFSAWRGIPIGNDDESIPIVGGMLRIPRVLHLKSYDRSPRSVVRLTRKNLMLRDNYQCQYCTKALPVRDLNIDHVLPRSRGGPDSWENLVTSCKRCNLAKSWKTPGEANMNLVRKPFKPNWTTSTQILMSVAKPHEEWTPYLKTG